MGDINDFEKAREGFASATATLPKDYLGENAERLLLIAEELRKSLGVELKLVRLVSDLEVRDPAKVEMMANELRWYVRNKFFDNERTHCHNIARIRTLLIRPFQTGSPEDRQVIANFDKLVAPLSNADNDILDSLEPLADDACETVTKIEKAIGRPSQTAPRDIARAEELKREFVARASDSLARARIALKKLSQLSEQLIDIAAG